MTQPIICIPRISKNISSTDIRYIFNDYCFGNIRKINIVPGKETNKAFISYSYWNTNYNTKRFRNALKRSEINDYVFDGNGCTLK